MSVEKLMPTRSEFTKANCILDLDEFLPPKLTIRINGVEKDLIPVVGEQLRLLDEAQNSVMAVSEQFTANKKLDHDLAIKTYFDFCKLCIPSLTMEDMNSMTTKQMTKLLFVCLKFVTDGDFSDEKKNSESPIQETQVSN